MYLAVRQEPTEPGKTADMAKNPKPRESRNPTLEVRDFGPIAHGTVEIRPLTVFAGPSNTGKSWLAGLIYALFPSKILRRRFLGSSQEWPPKSRNEVLLFPENPDEWAKSIKTGLPILPTKEEKTFLEQVFAIEAGQHVRQIQECIGVSKREHLIRQGAKTSSAKLNLRSEEDVITKLEIDKESMGVEIELPDLLAPPVKSGAAERLLDGLDNASLFLKTRQKQARESFSERENQEAAQLSFDWALDVARNMAFPGLGAYYGSASVWHLPADRVGLIHAYRSVVSRSVQAAARDSSVP